jgi:maltodextrin utilization protein YvdJ
MWFFVSLIPATIWVVLGYFILFSSTKTQGAVQKFGQILAVWVFIIAAFLPVVGAYASLSGFSLEAMMRPMHESMHPTEGTR